SRPSLESFVEFLGRRTRGQKKSHGDVRCPLAAKRRRTLGVYPASVRGSLCATRMNWTGGRIQESTRTRLCREAKKGGSRRRRFCLRLRRPPRRAPQRPGLGQRQEGLTVLRVCHLVPRHIGNTRYSLAHNGGMRATNHYRYIARSLSGFLQQLAV